jgi:hypothetical protein
MLMKSVIDRKLHEEEKKISKLLEQVCIKADIKLDSQGFPLGLGSINSKDVSHQTTGTQTDKPLSHFGSGSLSLSERLFASTEDEFDKELPEIAHDLNDHQSVQSVKSQHSNYGWDGMLIEQLSKENESLLQLREKEMKETEAKINELEQNLLEMIKWRNSVMNQSLYLITSFEGKLASSKDKAKLSANLQPMVTKLLTQLKTPLQEKINITSQYAKHLMNQPLINSTLSSSPSPRPPPSSSRGFFPEEKEQFSEVKNKAGIQETPPSISPLPPKKRASLKPEAPLISDPSAKSGNDRLTSIETPTKPNTTTASVPQNDSTTRASLSAPPPPPPPATPPPLRPSDYAKMKQFIVNKSPNEPLMRKTVTAAVAASAAGQPSSSVVSPPPQMEKKVVVAGNPVTKNDNQMKKESFDIPMSELSSKKESKNEEEELSSLQSPQSRRKKDENEKASSEGMTLFPYCVKCREYSLKTDLHLQEITVHSLFPYLSAELEHSLLQLFYLLTQMQYFHIHYLHYHPLQRQREIDRFSQYKLSSSDSSSAVSENEKFRKQIMQMSFVTKNVFLLFLLIFELFDDK